MKRRRSALCLADLVVARIWFMEGSFRVQPVAEDPRSGRWRFFTKAEMETTEARGSEARAEVLPSEFVKESCSRLHGQN